MVAARGVWSCGAARRAQPLVWQPLRQVLAVDDPRQGRHIEWIKGRWRDALTRTSTTREAIVNATASPVRGHEAAGWTPSKPRRTAGDRLPSVIRLNFSDPLKRVFVEPENGGRFSMTMERAVRACQKMVADEEMAKRKELAERESYERFDNEFLRPLHEWAMTNAHRVRGCYIVTPFDGGVEVYVVGQSEMYDFDLGDAVADLETALADRQWAVHTMLIPRPADGDGLRSHFDYDNALEVYADLATSQPEG